MKVGLLHLTLLDSGGATAARRLASMADAGIDHVACGDHVSFGGVGFDGLVQAAAIAALHPTLPISTGVYLLPLRHPTLVARQLADIDRLAPGRLVFGVGVGGEDRHEVEVCGVDPRHPGCPHGRVPDGPAATADRPPTTFHGRHVSVDEAVILPAPAAPIPMPVGGRSDAAVRRAGRLGDGWLGIWVSARRFAEATAQAAEAAADRPDWPARHVLQVWCGVADSKEAARACLAPAMEGFYGLPFERFERYSPYGRPEDVAEFLRPYVDAGCVEFNLITQSPDDGHPHRGDRRREAPAGLTPESGRRHGHGTTGPTVHHGRMRDVLAALRGVATGVLAFATAFVVAYVVTPGPGDTGPCEEDVACLPGFDALAVELLVVITVMPLASLLFAWILRLPRPWFYVFPAVWADGLAFTSAFLHVAVQATLALVAYAALAVLLRRATPAPSIGR